ncbi:SRPBCC family protein [Marinilabilia sp.]|uniref:SRPBCC family protein n=1 Tax=Marinilabilia sp. TaxID=2021252 RepID=UPI0025C16DC1|nr:SRPBCC family protein [Marinilabilia sp.]
MTRFESQIKTIQHPASVVYDKLSNFDNFSAVLPADKIKNWESDGDSCRFEVDGVGPVGLKIVEREDHKTIKYSSDGKVPFNFFLWIQLKEVKEGESKLKITLDAHLNPMIKLVAKGPLEKFIGILADGIAGYNY